MASDGSPRHKVVKVRSVFHYPWFLPVTTNLLGIGSSSIPENTVKPAQ